GWASPSAASRPRRAPPSRACACPTACDGCSGGSTEPMSPSPVKRGRAGVGAAMTSGPDPVLFAIPRSELGGAQRSLLLLLRALDRAAFPPFVLLGEDGPLASSLRALDVPFEVARSSFKSVRGIRDFAKTARRRGARILHLYAARTLAIAGRALGLAVVERVNLLRSAEAGGLVARPAL